MNYLLVCEFGQPVKPALYSHLNEEAKYESGSQQNMGAQHGPSHWLEFIVYLYFQM